MNFFYIGLILCLLPLGRIEAQGPIQVHANRHEFVFGQQVRFQLEASSVAPIDTVVLAYRSSDTQGTTVEKMTLDPANQIRVEYVHHVEQRYIRPFVELTYWWTIEDTAGAQHTTEPQSFAYVDNRFDWQRLDREGVTVSWYSGDLVVAQQVLDVGVEAMARAREDVPVEQLMKSIDIYLYAHVDDLNLALPAGLPLGADALTLYETNVILVPLGPLAENTPSLRRVVPHEVTHALIHEATTSDFDQIPVWLTEGLAGSVEHTFAPDPGTRLVLERALADGSVLPLNTLCAAFPEDWSAARLAYAESASVVGYIRDVYGRQALRALVAAYADGATCEGGVQRALGFSLDHLDRTWREYTAPQGAWRRFWAHNGAWVLLLVMLAVLPLALLRFPRAAIRAWKRGHS